MHWTLMTRDRSEPCFDGGRTLGALPALLALLLLGGCSVFDRDVQRSLPEFLRGVDGEEEIEILRQLDRARTYDEEAVARQGELMVSIRAERERLDALPESEREDGAEDLVTRIEDFQERYPGSRHDEELRYLLAISLREADELIAASEAYREFATNYPVSSYSRRVIEEASALGSEYLGGQHGTLFGLFSREQRGEEMLGWLIETYPTAPEAADAQRTLAKWHFDAGRYEPARLGYEFLVQRYETSEWFEEALYYSAWCRYAQVKGARYDPRIMKLARDDFERYLGRRPDGPRAEEASAFSDELRELQAEHLVEVGRWYTGQGQPFAGRFYLQSAVSRFPGTVAAEAAARELPPGPEVGVPGESDAPAALPDLPGEGSRTPVPEASTEPSIVPPPPGGSQP